MATKAELENAYARYHTACVTVVRAEAERNLHVAVREAEASLPLVHPAVAYRRRFLKAEPAAPTLDCILRCAPPLFLRAALDAVERWYAGGTRTERGALSDVPTRLADARRRLDRAAGLWSTLSAAPGARLVLDGRCPDAAAVVATWLSIGAVTEVRHPGRAEYVRAGDPRRPARGKCAGCGRFEVAPLARLLDPLPCPGCRQLRPFVIVGRPE